MSLLWARACKLLLALVQRMPSSSHSATTGTTKRRPSTMIRIPMAMARRVDAQLSEGTYANRSEWCRAAIINRLEEVEKRTR